ncbi:metal cation-transporting ATPase, partial [Caulochytrium protostelioides]
MHLALCHTVLPPKGAVEMAARTSPGGLRPLRYDAASPDELALVHAAREMGYVFLERQGDLVGLEMPTPLFATQDASDAPFAWRRARATFRVLAIIEFTSLRKRMSLVVEAIGADGTPGDIMLYAKGADTVIYERLAPGQDAMAAQSLEHLEHFAQEGLRTLCLAVKPLDRDWFAGWYARWQDACTDLVDRDEQMDALAAEIETDLTLLGATAIEDQLQEDLPHCIATLRAAGIKLWVLTGDKVETAINIG